MTRIARMVRMIRIGRGRNIGRKRKGIGIEEFKWTEKK